MTRKPRCTCREAADGYVTVCTCGAARSDTTGCRTRVGDGGFTRVHDCSTDHAGRTDSRVGTAHGTLRHDAADRGPARPTANQRHDAWVRRARRDAGMDLPADPTNPAVDPPAPVHELSCASLQSPAGKCDCKLAKRGDGRRRRESANQAQARVAREAKARSDAADDARRAGRPAPPAPSTRGRDANARHQDAVDRERRRLGLIP